MLTFREEFGEFYALRDGVVVASGDEARLMNKGQVLFEKQLANAKPGRFLARTNKNNLLKRRVKRWR